MLKRYTLFLGVVAFVAGLAVPAGAQTAPRRQVTFSKDIAPILQRSCQRCHRPNSVAPMSLLSYQQARPYARAMKQRTALARAPYARGSMPPWFLEKNIGIQRIKDDISLTDEEIDLIAQWADTGAPEGNPADLPPPLQLVETAEWTLGKPDLIISSETRLVPGVAPDFGGDLGEIPTGLTADRYISSAEWKEVSKLVTAPQAGTTGTVGSLFVFHHANARPVVRSQDGAREVGPRLPTHEVGRNGDVFQPENGRVLPSGSFVRFDVHIHSPGIPGADRNSRLDLGLRFHPQGYKPKYEAVEAHFGRSELDIIGNQDNQRIDAYWVAPQHTKLLNYEPHMHAAGVRMCLEAIYGRSIETINCAGYDHNWVRTYIYEDMWAPLLPKGTILHAISWFDNTTKNTNNVEPRNTATYGNSSTANMFQVRNDAIFLTEEEYQQELAKRREYQRMTGEELLACPECGVRRSAGGANGSR